MCLAWLKSPALLLQLPSPCPSQAEGTGKVESTAPKCSLSWCTHRRHIADKPINSTIYNGRGGRCEQQSSETGWQTGKGAARAGIDAEVAGVRSRTALLPSSCFLVVSPQFSPKKCLRKENTNLLKMKLGVLRLTLLLFYNEEMGGKVPWDAQGFHPKDSLCLLKLWWPMGEHGGGSVHYISLPKSADLARNTSASQLAGWAEPSFTTSQTFWQGVAKRRRDKPTQPQTGKA